MSKTKAKKQDYKDLDLKAKAGELQANLIERSCHSLR